MTKKLDKAKKAAEKRGIGSYERHILLCLGPDCCSQKEGEEAWAQLKKRTAQLNGSSDSGRIYRTKVGCLRVCDQGPVAVTPDIVVLGLPTTPRDDRSVGAKLASLAPDAPILLLHAPGDVDVHALVPPYLPVEFLPIVCLATIL